MGFNIAYNVRFLFFSLSCSSFAQVRHLQVFLVLVIKHGSAALMYASATVVLPLTSVAFTLHAVLKDHALPFDWFTGSGLAIVIVGIDCSHLF